MPYTVNQYELLRIVDRIENSVIALADAPAIFHALKLGCSRWTWVLSEIINSIHDALDLIRGEILQLAHSAIAYLDFVDDRRGVLFCRRPFFTLAHE